MQLDPTNSDGPISERHWAKSSNAIYRNRQSPFSTQSVALVRTFGILSPAATSVLHLIDKVNVIYVLYVTSGRKCDWKRE